MKRPVRHIARVEVLLWVFGLGWWYCSLNPAPLSLVARVLAHAGAAGIAPYVLALMSILGVASFLVRQNALLRIAHMAVAAAWWDLVYVLTLREVLPVHGAGWLWWLSRDTAAYSYGLIATLATIELFHVARRIGDPDVA